MGVYMGSFDTGGKVEFMSAGAGSISDCAVHLKEPDYVKDQEKAIEAAKEGGFEIIESSPHKLLLDLDSEEAYKQLDERLNLLNKVTRYSFRKTEEWRSKSNNWHVVLEEEMEFTIQERIMFELMLGSDPKRAIFSFTRSFDHHPNQCSLLFKPAGKVAAPKTTWFDAIE